MADSAGSPFEGAGLADDPYVRLLRAHCADPELMASGPAEVARRQQALLWPFLDFLLRHDQDGYYRRLYGRKGLLRGAEVRPDVVLADLAVLRIHSDDLRGPDGQRRRLIGAVAAEYDRCEVFRSSETSGNAAGPVTIARSPLMRRVKSYLTGQQFERAAGTKPSSRYRPSPGAACTGWCHRITSPRVIRWSLPTDCTCCRCSPAGP